jgi:transposase
MICFRTNHRNRGLSWILLAKSKQQMWDNYYVPSITPNQEARRGKVLQLQTKSSISAETASVAHAAFPKGNLYMTMRDEIGTLYSDQDFEELFSTHGQPAVSPWRLALVCVMQFMEELSDRQAADAVRSRIDWKYALDLELTDPGFDFSVLCEFRARLITVRNHLV